MTGYHYEQFKPLNTLKSVNQNAAVARLEDVISSASDL
jgi:hypothetical protein